MAGKVPTVDAAVMSEGPTAPRAMMGSVRGRVMRVRPMPPAVVPVSPVPVRSVTAMPVPAMTAASQGRNLDGQTDDRRQSNHVQTSHDSMPLLLNVQIASPQRANSRAFLKGCADQANTRHRARISVIPASASVRCQEKPRFFESVRDFVVKVGEIPFSFCRNPQTGQVSGGGPVPIA
jgi:hypothetical protein